MKRIPAILFLHLFILAACHLHAQTIVINEVMSVNKSAIFDEDGDTPDWIEFYNTGSEAVNLEGFGLTDDPASPGKWTFPPVVIQPQSFLLVFASGKYLPSGRDSAELHTNFRISATGETIVLSDSGGMVLDSVYTGYLPADVSKGRQPDGSSSWYYFTGSTPGSANIQEGWPGITSPVTFSQPAGFYPSGFLLTLSAEYPEDVIHFTTDGSEPGIGSPVYQNQVYIVQTKVVRAIAIHPGFLPGRVSTATYFIGTNHDLPVISLSTAPENLFDPETGIYHENNIWEDWERPIHMEFYEPDDSSGFSMDAGVKIYGGWTRTFPQKSLALFARESYGYDEIDYPIFPDLDIEQFESIVLRNSGNDWQVTMFRDGFMTGLVAEDGQDVQAFRPAVVYINGDYWGIHNIREKLNEHYVEAHHGANSDSVDLLEKMAEPQCGDAIHYNNMIRFIENNPLSDPFNYAYIRTQMEVANFIDYEITQIFICNTDWPGNNIKFWRPRTAAGRWRWMLYDTDFGFGLVEDYTHNTLAYATDPNGPEWPNPPWSTFLLRQLMTNASFRTDFINRYADLLNSSFRTETMLQQIDQKKQTIINEMPLHFMRWGGNFWEWLWNITVMQTFATERRAYAQNHVVGYFGLPEYAGITLDVEPEGAGKIDISTLHIENFPWSGEYFCSVPVPLLATAGPGYRFAGWQGTFPGDSAAMTVTFAGPAYITATFEAYEPDSIVINEINYHSAEDFNPEDWVEFTNTMDEAVDLTGWTFKDESDDHVFGFQAGTMLEPDDYLVLCYDTNAFKSLFPEVTNYTGNMSFGLSGNSELTRLYDFSGLLIDTVRYDDEAPWPPEPDGSGPTLELIDPAYDNALAESWLAYNVHGTPGSQNGPFTSVAGAELPADLECRVVPNPFRSKTEIQILAKQERVISIEIFSMQGERVFSLARQILQPGLNRLVWESTRTDGADLLPGLYLLRLTSGNIQIHRKMVIGH